jgi:DNA-binding CsgD family transcriptional regulator
VNPGHGGRATDGAPPLIVVDGPADAFDAAVAEVRDAGWQVVARFETPGAGGDEVRFGAVDTAEDAAAALLRVLEGAGAVIHARGDRHVLDRLLDDLRHVRRVDLRRGQLAAAAPPTVDADARAILAILAEGRTLGDAAATLGLSRRTADRRLADARTALGVERTVEAVARARAMGWLGRTQPDEVA